MPPLRWAEVGRSRPRSTAACLLVLVVAVVGVLGLGEKASGSVTDAGHVHAVAFDPGDGALLLGTHGGLYRLGRGDARPEKVGAVSYDLMGLAARAPRSYLASGHPDAAAARRGGLPANLGLIRTDDGGRRWRVVSLRGTADFHVLRARDDRVLAFDVVGGRLLASGNAGRTWEPRPVPPRTTDLGLGPAPGTVMASTADGLRVSADGGRTYRPRARDVGPGLVAWPSARTLLLIDAGGALSASSDGGRRFSRRGSVGGRPVAITAQGNRVAVILNTGGVLLSTDGGHRFAGVASP